MITTEDLLTSPAAYGITTATPAQRAIAHIADGLPLAELAEHPDVVALAGGTEARDAIVAHQRAHGAPTELVVLASIRSAKTILASAAAVRMAMTVDVSGLGPGEVPRVSVVSLRLDPVAIRRATREAPLELPPVRDGRYCAAVDTSEGSSSGNAMTLVIVRHLMVMGEHKAPLREEDGTVRTKYQVVLAREWCGTRPDDFWRDVASICGRYGLRTAYSDLYAGQATATLRAATGCRSRWSPPPPQRSSRRTRTSPPCCTRTAWSSHPTRSCASHVMG